MDINLLQLKRALRTVLFVLLLNAVGMTKMYASYDFSAVCETGQTLYYNIIDADNHFVELTYPGSSSYFNHWTGFTKPSGNIILSNSVQYNDVTYTLTSIGDRAFYGCSGLTGTLTIPNSVISIGDFAFVDCLNFTGALVIPNSVTSIGIEAFGRCEGFTSITIPNSIISISDWAFCYCSMSSLTIPNSVISIGDFAFAYCDNLSSISIGNSVASIGEHAFSLCSRLTSVFIPNSVTSIGENPFDQCSGLEQIVVESGNSVYDSRNNCNAIIHTSTNCLISGCKNTIILNSVTSIGNYAFHICTGLTGTMTIPNSVTSIGDFAFLGCRNLTGTLVIPNSVTIIGKRAFEGCSGITGNLTIPSSVISIGEYAFVRCSGIEQIVVDSGNPIYDSRDNCNAIIRTFTNRLVFGCKNTIIPNSVTSIESEAFYQCKGLTSIIIPNFVISIGNTAFYDCSSLISITIGNSVTTIGLQAFGGCTNLESMTVLAETPPTLGTSTFQCPKSIPVYVPCESGEAYTTANWGGFRNFIGFCGGMVSVAANPEEGGMVIGGGVFGADETCTVMATESEGYSFAFWTQNGRKVSNNAEYTFYVSGEMDLVAHFMPNFNITFADSNVKSICVSHWDADNDGELSYVEAATVSNLGNYFRNNSVITSFDELQYFVGLVLFGDYEFSGCTGLTSIEIPNFVTSIGKSAFYNCRSLTSIEIPNSVTSIGSSAFYNCYGLTSIEIPNSVTSIGSSAFYYCRSLTSIEIPNSVTSIGSSAFQYCRSLASIEIPNSVTSIGSSAFQSCRSLTSIEIPNSVTSVGNSAFQSCSSLTSIEIPNSVTSIGNSAFQFCSGLEQIVVALGNTIYDSRDNCNAIIETSTNVLVSGCKNTVIPSSVTSIGSSAFSGCSNLASIVIPNSLVSIGDYAFRSCSGLTSITIQAEMPPTIYSSTFYNCPKSIPLYVPCGSAEAYQSAAYWNEFTNIQEDCHEIVHFVTAGNWSEATNWQDGTLPGTHAEIYIDANCLLDLNAEVADLNISDGQPLTLQSGKTLTVTNVLTNAATTGLVIEDGAQLVHASENVSAMVKKNITGHGTNNGRYCLISNPLTTVVDPEMSSVYHLITGDYDLYDWLPSAPDSLEWRNYKTNDFMMLPEGYGYLYANRNDVELNFPGILKPSHNRYAKSVSYDSNDTEHPGWNLIGNPFVCNAYLVDEEGTPLPYYRMNTLGNGFEAVAPGTPIAPMEGVFYKASGNGTVYFIRVD